MIKDYFLGISEEGFHKVSYLEWGTPQTQPPVICVHGLTRVNRDFDTLASYLSARGRHLYCPDIVGRGDSDWLHNPLHYTFEQYIADMNALIARTRATTIDWVGTSMGGLIGMMMAGMEKTPIRRLVLNDIGPQISTQGLGRLAKYAGLDPDFPNFAAAKAYFKTVYADLGQLSEEQWENLTETSIREVSPGRYVTKIDHGIKATPAKSTMAWRLLLNPRKALEGTFFDIDLWHVWRKLSCPVLVIHGKNSDILTSATIDKMRDIHPATEVLEISDAGHAPALLDESQHEVIHRFLSS